MNARTIDLILHRKRETKKELYLYLFRRIFKKIEDAARMGKKELRIEVPPFVTGFPPFDIGRASSYLTRQLVLAKFDAAKINQSTIHVSWGNHQKYHQKAMKTKESEERNPQSFSSFANLKKVARNLIENNNNK